MRNPAQTIFIIVLALLGLGAEKCDRKLPCIVVDGISTCPASPSPIPSPSAPPTTVPPPVASPQPSAAPSAVPTAPPTEIPPSAAPSAVPATPKPCVQRPQCVNDEGTPTPDCVSCAEYAAGMDKCEDAPKNDGKPCPAGLRWNEDAGGNREFLDPKTCNYVWPDGSLRNYRPHRDGSVCNPPGCAPNPKPCPPSPPPPPARPPSPWPLPTNAPPVNVSLTESGNLPLPAGGACWSPGVVARYGPVIAEYGVAVLSQRVCSGRGAPPNCFITNIHATPKSVKPYCEHSCYDEQGRYSLGSCRNKCETLRPCQPSPYVGNEKSPLGGAPDFIGMFIAHPQWGNVWGVCDKRSAGAVGKCADPDVDCRSNYICHDQAIDRYGETHAMACPPPGNDPTAPGCTTTSYGRPLGRARGGKKGTPETGIPTRPRKLTVHRWKEKR